MDTKKQTRFYQSISVLTFMQVGAVPQHLLPLLESFLPSLQKVLCSTVYEDSKFSALVESVDVLLFSGSDAALTQVMSRQHSVPTICIPRDPAAGLRRATIKHSSLQHFRWRHRMLGGVTNGSLQVGCQHIDFTNFKPPLRRTIKHILEFSARPKSCTDPPPFLHYKATDVVRMDALTQPVVYKSPHFCVTGWGVCKLSLGELGCAFDLPSRCVALVTEPTRILSHCISGIFAFSL